MTRSGDKSPCSGALAWSAIWLLVGLFFLPLPALAEDIVWYGQGDQRNSGQLRDAPYGASGGFLYPDGPSGNSVTVYGDVPDEVWGGFDYFASYAATSGNSLTVNSGTMKAVVGGAASSPGGSATARGNSVTVNDGTITNVVGGTASSPSGSATASGNSVTVNGGTIVHVTGGEAHSSGGSAAATGNSVTVNGGTIKNVVGGIIFNLSGSGAATGNSVTLSGSPAFAPGGIILGATTKVAAPCDLFSGNTLNIWNYTGSAANEVGNFQYYNFVLPAAMQSGGTLFTANHVSFDDSSGVISNGVPSAITGVSIMGGGTALRAGESVTLMTYTKASGSAANGNAIVEGRKGSTLLYSWQLAQTGTELKATVVSRDINPQAKSLPEGRLAGLTFVNQGADLIAGPGLDAARRSKGTAGGAGYGLSPFIVGQGGSSRYDTGSHVDVNGFSVLAGLAWNRQTECGALLLGAFFEAGWGNYDSHNSFSGYAQVKGDGDTEYYGGGLLGRFDFNSTGPGNIYTEASFRMGSSETDFSSSDLRDGAGNKAGYDSDSLYYGLHLGLGYIWNITEASSLDLYTRYFWTHQDSDSVTVTGDPVKFKSADSHRWRGGARFAHSLTTEKGQIFTPYIGAAYEHEFDGKARASTYGYSIDAPDLEGGTGMGEVGLSIQPCADSGLSFDVGVQGYTGQREGLTGSFQLKWEF